MFIKVVVLLAEKNIPIIQISNPANLTCLNQIVTLDAGSSSMASDIKVDWTTWNGSIVSGVNSYGPVVNAQGSYTLTLTDESSKCIAQDSVFVSLDTVPPIAEAGADMTIPCGQSIPLLDASQSTGQGALTFQWTTLDGSIQGTTNSVNAIAVSPGTYQLFVTDEQNGCSASDMVVLYVQDGLNSAEIDLSPPLCTGDFNGVIEVTGIQGGLPPYIATLGGNHFALPGKVDQLGAGNYSLSIIDGQGCTWDTLLVLVDPFPFQLDLGLDLEITLGESVSLIPVITGGIGSVNSHVWTKGNELLCQCCTSLHIVPT
jgi:hypothetical protein